MITLSILQLNDISIQIYYNFRSILIKIFLLFVSGKSFFKSFHIGRGLLINFINKTRFFIRFNHTPNYFFPPLILYGRNLSIKHIDFIWISDLVNSEFNQKICTMNTSIRIAGSWFFHFIKYEFIKLDLLSKSLLWPTHTYHRSISNFVDPTLYKLVKHTKTNL